MPLAAREGTENWSLVLTWLLEGPTKTDMLSEAGIGRTEHTTHQSAVLDIEGRAHQWHGILKDWPSWLSLNGKHLLQPA